MLSHGNILANVEQCRQTGMARIDDPFLSILPLSHMFERTGGYYLPLSIGAKVAYRARHRADRRRSRVAGADSRCSRCRGSSSDSTARIEQRARRVAREARLFDACVARGYRVSDA